MNKKCLKKMATGTLKRYFSPGGIISVFFKNFFLFKKIKRNPIVLFNQKKKQNQNIKAVLDCFNSALFSLVSASHCFLQGPNTILVAVRTLSKDQPRMSNPLA